MFLHGSGAKEFRALRLLERIAPWIVFAIAVLMAFLAILRAAVGAAPE